MAAFTKFGLALRALRGDRSLAVVAGRARVTVSNLSKYELEKKGPTVSTLERILDGLGISLLDLALEVERQQRVARGETPGIPPSAPLTLPVPEERMREIAREEFQAGLAELVLLPSADIEAFSAGLRAEGIEPDLEGLALLQQVIAGKRRSGGEEG